LLDTSAAFLPAAEIERVFGQEYGRAVAVLVRVFGDIDIAEEAVQDAFTAAASRWPPAGLPPSPAGWIITTARNRAIDYIRSADGRMARSTFEIVENLGAIDPQEGLVETPALARA